MSFRSGNSGRALLFTFILGCFVVDLGEGLLLLGEGIFLCRRYLLLNELGELLIYGSNFISGFTVESQRIAN